MVRLVEPYPNWTSHPITHKSRLKASSKDWEVQFIISNDSFLFSWAESPMQKVIDYSVANLFFKPSVKFCHC
jgi:hypothetical protein